MVSGSPFAWVVASTVFVATFVFDSSRHFLPPYSPFLVDSDSDSAPVVSAPPLSFPPLVYSIIQCLSLPYSTRNSNSQIVLLPYPFLNNLPLLF